MKSGSSQRDLKSLSLNIVAVPIFLNKLKKLFDGHEKRDSLFIHGRWDRDASNVREKSLKAILNILTPMGESPMLEVSNISQGDG